MASAYINIQYVYFRPVTMATRWGCVGAGFITSDFFTAIRETLPVDEHKVKLTKKGRFSTFATNKDPEQAAFAVRLSFVASPYSCVSIDMVTEI